MAHAGWYPDPETDDGWQRYWDGAQWADDRRPPPPAQPPQSRATPLEDLPPPIAPADALPDGPPAPATSLDAPALADERAAVERQFHALERAWKSLPDPESVATKLRDRAQQAIVDRLAAVPVSVFQDIGAPRSGALLSSPLRSVLDVLRTGESGLTRLPGIGGKSAPAITDVATLIAEDAVHTLPVRLGKDEASDAARALLVTQTLVGEVPDEAIEAARGELITLPATPSPFEAPRKRFFQSRRRHEEEIEQARVEHQAALAAFAQRLADARAAVDELPDPAIPDAPTIRDEVRANAAGYAARFERFVQETFPELFSAAGMRTRPVIADDEMFVMRWLDPTRRPEVDLAELQRLRDREAALTTREPSGGTGLSIMTGFAGFRGSDAPRAQRPLPRTVRATTADLGTVLPPSDVAAEIAAVELLETDLAHPLRSYQAFAAKFVLHTDKVVIGDEMGLGKTVEALAAAMHVLETEARPQILIVAPASVIPNWTREVSKWLGLDPYVFHASAKGVMADAQAAWLTDGGIAVTTYGSMRHAAPEGSEAEQLELIVFDEAHLLKNPDTKRTQAAERLIKRSDRVVLMTGTPMTSHISDFVNLVRLIDTPMAGRMAAATTDAETFRLLVSGRYLRRTQNDVLDELPEIVEVDELIEPTDDDLRAYESELRRSPYLMTARSVVGNRVESSKMSRLKELWDEAAEDGQSMVVFSYFLDTLAAADHVLGEDVVGTIHGGVSPAVRQQLVDSLSATDRPQVLLAQIESGGVGLNIQAASVGVICEPQFNPSVEFQAIKRMHRMGQTRAVLVHRLVSQGLIDEPMVALRDRKAITFAQFVAGSELATAAGHSDGVIDEAMLLTRELNRLRIGDHGASEAAPHVATQRIPPAPRTAAVPQTTRTVQPVPLRPSSTLDLSDRVIALDFETANPARWSVCEIGLASPDHAFWSTLIDPATHFAPANTHVHGIDPAQVGAAPGLHELADVLGTLDGFTVVAHNVEFERSVVRQLFAHLDREPPVLRWLCTLDLARQHLPHLPDHRLPTVARAVGANMGRHHCAADDAVAAMAIAQLVETGGA